MKILAIGNSFSQDATRYLHQIAEADNTDLKIVNLYIGGCSLERHYYNIFNDIKDYSFEFNGECTGINVSIREALLSDKWDVVTLQQVSSKSYNYETYQPYLNSLADYVRFYAPTAKLYIHQTWAYEQGSELLQNHGFSDQKDMFLSLESAYIKAAEEIKAYGIIPSGKAFQNLLSSGIKIIHRDTFHASYGLGRYTLGLVWYEALTGKSCIGNAFRKFDEEIPEEEIKTAQICANTAIKKGPYK